MCLRQFCIFCALFDRQQGDLGVIHGFSAFKDDLSLFFACELQFFVVWCSGGKTIQGWICDWSDRAIGGLHYAGGVAHDHIGLDVMPRQSELRWWRHGTRVWGSVVKNGISDHLRQALLSASSGLALRDTEDRGRPGRGLNKRGRWCAVVGRGEDKCRVCAGGGKQ